MKINWSSILILKFATGSKRRILDSVMDEYARVKNFFIQKFHKSPMMDIQLYFKIETGDMRYGIIYKNQE